MTELTIEKVSAQLLFDAITTKLAIYGMSQNSELPPRDVLLLSSLGEVFMSSARSVFELSTDYKQLEEAFDAIVEGHKSALGDLGHPMEMGIAFVKEMISEERKRSEMAN